MYIPWSVDTSRKRLLDVGRPTRTGDDRECARQSVTDHDEELRYPRQDAAHRKSGDVRLREKRRSARLVWCGGKHNAPRIGKSVERTRDSCPRQVRRCSAMHGEAAALRRCDEAIDETIPAYHRKGFLSAGIVRPTFVQGRARGAQTGRTIRAILVVNQ